MHIHKKRVVLIADAKASDTFLAVCDGKLEWVQGASVPANHGAQWVIRKSGKSNIVRNRQESALFLSGNGNHHLVLSKMHDGVNSLSIIQCPEAGGTSGAKQFQFSVTPDVGDKNPTYAPLQVKSPSGATMVTKFTFSSQAFAQDSVAQPSETSKKMSPGMIAGIVIVSLVALALIIGGIWFMVTSRNFRFRQEHVATLPAPPPPAVITAPTLPINGPVNGAAPTSLFDFFE